MNVLITQRIERNKWGKKVDSIDHNLINFVNKLNLVPCLIPNKLHNYKKKLIESYLRDLKPKLLIISGGGSIKIKDDRFFTELYLIKHLIKKRVPIFGICRGMQMLSKFFDCDIKKVKGHVSTKHKIKYKFKNLIVTRKVNSYHNYSIKKLPKQFIEIGTSYDGEIEAILNKKLLLCGIMWHPEREKIINKKDIQLIKYLISLSRIEKKKL